MLKSKTFLKKTRAGGVVKIVREHYLRDDIGCGAPACAACDGAHAGQALESQPRDQASSLCPWPHYLLPDTNVLLHQVRAAWGQGAGLGVEGRGPRGRALGWMERQVPRPPLLPVIQAEVLFPQRCFVHLRFSVLGVVVLDT